MSTSGEAGLRILKLRRSNARWGPKKLHAALARPLKAADLPSQRIIARILERAALAVAEASAQLDRDAQASAAGVTKRRPSARHR